MVIQKNKKPLISTMEYGNISVIQLKNVMVLFFSAVRKIRPTLAGLIKSNLVSNYS